jgi:hypothetical protein
MGRRAGPDPPDTDPADRQDVTFAPSPPAMPNTGLTRKTLSSAVPAAFLARFAGLLSWRAHM